MNKLGKIITYSIAVGLILLLAFFAACVLVLQDRGIDYCYDEDIHVDSIAEINRISVFEQDYNQKGGKR